MMKKIILFFSISFSLSSCFLFQEYQKETFSYDGANNQRNTVAVIVPKGYNRATYNIDSSGNTKRIYEYGGGTFLYVGYLKDTSNKFQTIDESNALPHEHPLGGWVYKGVDHGLKFWREIRRGGFVLGYKNVSLEQEPYFDSATNFISLQNLK